MAELEKLRELVGPEADHWSTEQLEQLRADIESMAVLLLDLYLSNWATNEGSACGSPKIDDLQPDR